MKKSVTGRMLLFCAAVFALPFSVCAGGSKDSNKKQNAAMMPHENGQPPNMPGNMSGGPGMPGIEGKAAELTAVLTTDGAKQDSFEISGKTLQGIGPDQNVLLALNKGKLAVSKVILYKTGDSSDPNQSNFSGLNAVVVAESGSIITLKDVTVNSDAEGSNAVFATGDGSVIHAKHITIHTTGNSSRGLDATYNGTITADTVDITTEGAHSAALATDRGEGTITVNGGTVRTAGEGSPNIYSTGTISAMNLIGMADGSEIAVIEGKNAITLDTCHLAGYGDHGILLYQSMPGDAGEGTGVFTVRNSDLQSYANGPFFYVTNTQAKVYISNTRLTWPAAILIQVSGNDSSRGWGRKGSNGGTLAFTAENQTLAGNITCDEISSVNLIFKKGVSYKGAIDSAKTGKVSVSLDNDAVWTVTADSYIDVLQDSDNTFANIHAAGHTVYYDKTDTANNWLKGKKYTLADGKLAPYTAKRQNISSSEQKNKQSDTGGQGMSSGTGGPKTGNGNPPPEGQMDFNGNPPPAPPSGSMNADNSNQPPAPPSGNGKQGQPFEQQQKKAAVIPSDAIRVTAHLVISGSGNEAKTRIVTEDGKQYALQLFDRNVKLQSPESIAENQLECTGIVKQTTPSSAGNAETPVDGTFILYSYRITEIK